MVETQFHLKIKPLQTYWDEEYQALVSFLSSFGILHRMSCPHTHERNRLAERKHHQIVYQGLSLLAQASIHLDFWDEAFYTIVYVVNRLYHLYLEYKSTLGFLYKTKPCYDF